MTDFEWEVLRDIADFFGISVEEVYMKDDAELYWAWYFGEWRECK